MTVTEDLHALACELAVTAGDLALAAGRPTAWTTTTKSTVTDMVTATDRAAEAAIVEGLRTARPNDAILGEEGTNRAGTSGITWHLDPIDGTTNYVYGLAHWATSIAAEDAAGMVVGAVYVPVLGELFAARRGGGATLNGEVISCRPTTELALALVATGFAYVPERRVRQGEIVSAMLPAVRDIRRLGSAAIDLCYVAAGRFDAYFEDHLNLWDYAAAELIAREAGCRTTSSEASVDGRGVVAATPAIYDGLVSLLPSGRLRDDGYANSGRRGRRTHP